MTSTCGNLPHTYAIIYHMLERHIKDSVRKSLALFPVTLVIGARQVGKSTLAEQLVAQGILDSYITLDDITHLEAAQQDPDLFLANLEGAVAIDEVQRVPDLLRALKKVVDEHNVPGRFLLTGSANILAYPELSESLAGRMEVIRLEGLSIAEMLKTKRSLFVNALFTQNNFADYLQQLRSIKQPIHIDKKLLQKVLLLGVMVLGFRVSSQQPLNSIMMIKVLFGPRPSRLFKL